MIFLCLCDSVVKTGRQLFVKVSYLLRFEEAFEDRQSRARAEPSTRHPPRTTPTPVPEGRHKKAPGVSPG
jgi:hypothetical protein